VLKSILYNFEFVVTIYALKLPEQAPSLYLSMLASVTNSGLNNYSIRCAVLIQVSMHFSAPVTVGI
jgi:hypothetical protein